MPAHILDGRALAKDLRDPLAARVATLQGRGVDPLLCVVAIGSDDNNASYVRGIERFAAQVGVAVRVEALAAEGSRDALRAKLAALAADEKVHGIMLAQPLPAELDVRKLASDVPPEKDVDGVNPCSQGALASGSRVGFAPATPAAVMLLLERSAMWPLRGRDVTVVGRSTVVGLPLALLLIARDATVTVVHRGTADMAGHVARADVLIAAAGRPGLVTGDMLRPGATVVDVGTTYVDGMLRGDVDFASAVAVAGEITPVPGGVGPVTSVALLTNVVRAAEHLSSR